MKRRTFIKSGIAAGTFGSLASGIARAAASTKRPPNLVIVFPDQMQNYGMGFMNKVPVKTPILDHFAKESLVLTEAVSNYPICSPFRAILMTGMAPHKNSVLKNTTGPAGRIKCELKQDAICWSDVLKTKGYSLGYIGKWHLDTPHEPFIECYNNNGGTKWNEWCPPERRHSFDFWNSYGTYDRHMNPMYWTTDAKRDEYYFAKEYGPKHETDIALNYIRNTDGKYRDSSKPFAMVVSMNPPHMPYRSMPQKYKDMYKNIPIEKFLNRPDIPAEDTKMGELYRKEIRNYYAQITAVDEQFGRILAALKEQNLEEDTIVLFTSDHGNCLGIHGNSAKNNPYEESMRVPFIIRWPGKIKPRQDELLISSADIYPTLMELMGFKNDIPACVDGTSHASLMQTGHGKRPTSQWYMRSSPGTPHGGVRGVRTEKYKLSITIIRDKKNQKEKPNIMLFDLKNDPYEMNNIAADSKQIITKLVTEELEPWLKHNADPWIRYIKLLKT